MGRKKNNIPEEEMLNTLFIIFDVLDEDEQKKFYNLCKSKNNILFNEFEKNNEIHTLKNFLVFYKQKNNIIQYFYEPDFEVSNFKDKLPFYIQEMNAKFSIYNIPFQGILLNYKNDICFINPYLTENIINKNNYDNNDKYLQVKQNKSEVIGSEIYFANLGLYKDNNKNNIYNEINTYLNYKIPSNLMRKIVSYVGLELPGHKKDSELPGHKKDSELLGYKKYLENFKENHDVTKIILQINGYTEKIKRKFEEEKLPKISSQLRSTYPNCEKILIHYSNM